MRAYHYVYLINFFGDVPWVTRTLDISDSELYGAREDKEKLVDWVLKELELSSNQLPYAKDLKTTELEDLPKKRLGLLVLVLPFIMSVGILLFQVQS